jgi:hypothetical protein
MAKRKPARSTNRALVSAEQVDGAILVIRGQKVLLDEQLALFYGVETKKLVQAVKRNLDRFPDDFMFQLDREEWIALRSQFAASNLRSQIVTSSSAVHGGRRESAARDDQRIGGRLLGCAKSLGGKELANCVMMV